MNPKTIIQHPFTHFIYPMWFNQLPWIGQSYTCVRVIRPAPVYAAQSKSIIISSLLCMKWILSRTFESISKIKQKHARPDARSNKIGQFICERKISTFYRRIIGVDNMFSSNASKFNFQKYVDRLDRYPMCLDFKIDKDCNFWS